MLFFADIFDQDAAVTWLRGSLAADRLTHGLIFSGPVGVGKASTAAALGAMLLCEHPGPSDACGHCESCRAMGTMAHPDFHVITKELARVHDKTGKSKATQLSIEVIRRELSEPAGHKTVLGRGKVFVVEQAELMTSAAQNALLKTLEEPAGRTAIILLTDQPSDLLATVRSRCQLVRFAKLPLERVETELARRGIDAKQAKLAAELADGSLGTALRWIEDGVVSAAAIIAGHIDAAMAGSPRDSFAEDLKFAADALADKGLERDELASKDSLTRESLAVYLSIAARQFRKHLLADDPDLQERACEGIEAIARAEKYLDANVNVALVLEQLAIKLQTV